LVLLLFGFAKEPGKAWTPAQLAATKAAVALDAYS